MKNFIRSTRYLLPYRGRLAWAVVCVILISALWGGGLGMLVPGSKILISEEGLHGWAYGSIADDRLDLRVVQRTTRAGTKVGGRDVVEILDVMDVTAGGRGDRAGIRKGDWLLGIYDGNPNHELMRGMVLARQLSELSQA